MKGNDALKANNVEEAIECYTKSVNYNPNNPFVYCNRALAYKMKEKFQLMFDDSQAAIELDDQFFKGYLRNGEACMELGKGHRFENTEWMDKGIKRLHKAISILERIKESSPEYP